MGKSKRRGGDKAHNKRVQTRNKNIKENDIVIENLKKKIFEEAKERYLSGQTKETTWNIS
jgi:hypothetical protein